jgi:hypothetical protein
VVGTFEQGCGEVWKLKGAETGALDPASLGVELAPAWVWRLTLTREQRRGGVRLGLAGASDRPRSLFIQWCTCEWARARHVSASDRGPRVLPFLDLIGPRRTLPAWSPTMGPTTWVRSWWYVACLLDRWRQRSTSFEWDAWQLASGRGRASDRASDSLTALASCHASHSNEVDRCRQRSSRHATCNTSSV